MKKYLPNVVIYHQNYVKFLLQFSDLELEIFINSHIKQQCDRDEITKDVWQEDADRYIESQGLVERAKKRKNVAMAWYCLIEYAPAEKDEYLIYQKEIVSLMRSK
jgi:hypothetical protein